MSLLRLLELLLYGADAGQNKIRESHDNTDRSIDRSHHSSDKISSFSSIDIKLNYDVVFLAKKKRGGEKKKGRKEGRKEEDY